MPRFIVTRTLPPLSREQIDGVVESVLRGCTEVGEMSWIRSHITADGKHSFCEFEALTADACRQHARVAGLPLDDVVPLGLEIGPVNI